MGCRDNKNMPKGAARGLLLILRPKTADILLQVFLVRQNATACAARASAKIRHIAYPLNDPFSIIIFQHV